MFDCWFESGSMPYAQVHYPFERKEEFESNFPADFIAEGIDQTRGWFYTLLVISTALFDKPPFKSLIANGLVLASDGQKMSKRKKNYPDPSDIIRKYGADSIRLYLISSPAVRGDALKFNEAGVKDIIKDAFLPWYNALKFLMQNVERWESEQKRPFVYEEIRTYTGTNIMDKWILSSMQSLIKFVREEMALYKLYIVLPRLIKFIDTLCNWYVRLNRRRLRGDGGDADGDSFLALNTLFNVLFFMARLCAPFVPFLAESMHQRLRKYLSADVRDQLEYASVHYLLIPEANESLIDADIEKLFGVMQKIILLGRVIRDRRTMPLRHPLRELIVIVEDYAGVSDAIVQVRSYIFEELNVKDFKLTTRRDEYGIQMKAKANFPVLAVKAKDKMRSLSGLIEKMSDSDVQQLRDTGKFVLDGYEITLDDVKLLPKCDASSQFSQYEADFDENVIVLLDITPDEAMVHEGVLRDICNRVQRLRKEFKIVPTDDIVVYYRCAGGEASKLLALLDSSVEFLEANIKKPVRKYTDALTLNSKSKQFEVSRRPHKHTHPNLKRL